MISNSNILLPLCLLLTTCMVSNKSEPIAETVIYGDIHTMNADKPTASAMAITAGRILAIGHKEDVEVHLGPNTKIINFDDQFVFPGLIEGHGHFTGLGESQIFLNLSETKSWDEILALVDSVVQITDENVWIKGRGWHQEKWLSPLSENVEGYPTHHALSELSPNNPVMLVHASGHSLFANARAMNEAGVNRETSSPNGGVIIRDEEKNAVGVFEETAMSMIDEVYETYLDRQSKEQKYIVWKQKAKKAVEACLSHGITSFQDAGTNIEEMEFVRRLMVEDRPDVRLWMMLRDSTYLLKSVMGDYPIVGEANGFLTVRALKAYLDGALGAYGAWLLEPYKDRAAWYGQPTATMQYIEDLANLAIEHDMQYCVHAIGDRANREVLNLFESMQSSHDGLAKDHRWRIEHAQHLSPDDIPRFEKLGVIASMQAVHCTSDAPFVVKRLGTQRAQSGAYVWRALLDSKAHIANGTDTPVERINPFECLYATVTRKRPGENRAFFAEQVLSRYEALYSYTLGNAYAAFEEDLKGSLEVGKMADFVVLDHNLKTCTDLELLKTVVLSTFVDGRLVFARE